MDLNDLYQRHHAALFMAENASIETVRQIHRDFGQRYAAHIADAKLRQLEASSV